MYLACRLRSPLAPVHFASDCHAGARSCAFLYTPEAVSCGACFFCFSTSSGPPVAQLCLTLTLRFVQSRRTHAWRSRHSRCLSSSSQRAAAPTAVARTSVSLCRSRLPLPASREPSSLPGCRSPGEPLLDTKRVGRRQRPPLNRYAPAHACVCARVFVQRRRPFLALHSLLVLLFLYCAGVWLRRVDRLSFLDLCRKGLRKLFLPLPCFHAATHRAPLPSFRLCRSPLATATSPSSPRLAVSEPRHRRPCSLDSVHFPRHLGTAATVTTAGGTPSPRPVTSAPSAVCPSQRVPAHSRTFLYCAPRIFFATLHHRVHCARRGSRPNGAGGASGRGVCGVCLH